MMNAETLKSLLHYDPATGVFTWLVRAARKIHIGDVAGSVTSERGQRQIRLLNRRYYAHRLAWLYVHGEWPVGEIDHINGDPADNRIANLRPVSHAVNMQNRRRADAGNQAGLLGVDVCSKTKRFRARIHFAGKTHWLGRHATPELAHAAYVAAKRRYHEGCTL